jgi:predicted P-loop ATPase
MKELGDCTVFVKTYLDKLGIDFNALEAMQGAGTRLTQEDILLRMQTKYNEVYTGYNLGRDKEHDPRYPKYSKQDLVDAFKFVASTTAENKFEALKDRLAFRADIQTDPVAQWVYKTIKGATGTDVAAYKHFIWQVKRKINGLPVEYEMMINIKGAQGAGKTYSTRRFCSPLKELVTERRLSELLDERNHYSLSKTYINIFEELAGASKTDIDALKALMSKRELSWRMLGHNAHSFGHQNCTFISTANLSVAEAFYDPSGMRRFYEVEFLDQESVDREYINTCNVEEIWQSVDHTGPYPLAQFKLDLADKQEVLRQKNSIELYVENYPLEITETNGIKAMDFYKDYATFCKEMNMKPVSQKYILNRLKELDGLGGATPHRRSDGIYYNVKKITRRMMNKEFV